MKYKELISFEPIETVIQLRDANNSDEAKRLVETYVISEDMADRFVNLIFPQIQFTHQKDNKGLLIVGNYGTGKSHLMSFISAIAENETYLSSIQNLEVQTAAESVAGKFKVLRIEIGAVTTPLREIIVSELETHLASLDINFSFPPMNQLSTHKPVFEDMMAEFDKKYPNQGLMVVVDELLDYLKTRKDQEIILDLNFLRELGEVAKNLRFRFIAGIQEAIFDNPRFAYVAKTLSWVKARYEDVFIAKNDVKFVVKERLLKKSLAQEASIREYLTPFAKYYDDMNERMDEFVKMFPVHPNYIDTFERVTVIEKREILKTLSHNMRDLLEEELPLDNPGLIAYDSYWNYICTNATFRSIPDVREVIKCSQVLIDRINQAFTRPIYKPMALRIINGLSLHRLTTEDITSPLGATPSELQNQLCLFEPMIAELGGDDPARNLLTHIESVLKEIIKTVSGQFISQNKENDQYYLDLDKVSDFDALIEKRAESLNDSILDRYYFNALLQVMECPDTTYANEYNIWEYELEWKEKNVGRTGYLFFGSPNERSTVTPPRDFYLYFLQPNEPPRFQDLKKADEVFIRLKSFDEGFSNPLKYFAAAVDLSQTSSGSAKTAYAEKARGHLKDLVSWLQKHIHDAFEITYQGSAKLTNTWLKSNVVSSSYAHTTINFKEIIDTVSSACLAAHFSDLAPEYPTFSIKISEKNREQSAAVALQTIAGARPGKQAVAVLDALELLDGERLAPANSQYVAYIQNLLDQKGHGQVCNRSEVLISENGIEYMNPNQQRLEPEWVIVVLAAMIYNGSLQLAIPGKKFDATNLNELASTSINTLVQFKHLEKPKDWNIIGLKVLFDLFGLAPGYVNTIMQGQPEGVQQLQAVVNKTIQDILQLQQTLKDGVSFWNESILTPAELSFQNKNLVQLKEFFEGLQRFDTPGKLKNFKFGVQEISDIKEIYDAVFELASQINLLLKLSPSVTWLSQAEAYMLPDSEWIQTVQFTRQSLLETVRTKNAQSLKDDIRSVMTNLTELKKSYINNYVQLHLKSRLNTVEDQRKAALINDTRLNNLRKLSIIDLLPKQDLPNFLNRLGQLVSCFSLTEDQLNNTPICPHCKFNPTDISSPISAKMVLEGLDQELDKMMDSWLNTLLETLEDPFTQQNIELLDLADQRVVQEFLTTRELPQPVDTAFAKTLQTVFSGLEKISISMLAIKAELQKTSGAFTAEDLKTRFNNYIDFRLKGKDPSKVRFVIEDEI